ncbi:MAG: helix-turn-helix domain-containing protein [Thermomicrobiales bacterium]
MLVFAESGSVSTTAAKLYCHRNTVLNRIRKFEEATGISLRTSIAGHGAAVSAAVMSWSPIRIKPAGLCRCTLCELDHVAPGLWVQPYCRSSISL